MINGVFSRAVILLEQSTVIVLLTFSFGFRDSTAAPVLLFASCCKIKKGRQGKRLHGQIQSEDVPCLNIDLRIIFSTLPSTQSAESK
jgi:hypothetical protein